MISSPTVGWRRWTSSVCQSAVISAMMADWLRAACSSVSGRRSSASSSCAMRRALEEHGAARDLRRVRGEDGDDLDAAQRVERFVATEPRVLHAAQGAAEGAGLRRAFGAQLRGDAAALAVVRLGDVGQLEVDGEGFRQPVRLFGLDARDDVLGALRELLLVERGGRRRPLARLRVALPDGVLPQLLDRVVEFVAGLLFQDLPEQPTEQAHVAAQGRLLQVPVVARQLRQPRRLIGSLPERFRLRLACHRLPTSTRMIFLDSFGLTVNG